MSTGSRCHSHSLKDSKEEVMSDSFWSFLDMDFCWSFIYCLHCFWWKILDNFSECGGKNGSFWTSVVLAQLGPAASGLWDSWVSSCRQQTNIQWLSGEREVHGPDCVHHCHHQCEWTFIAKKYVEFLCFSVTANVIYLWSNAISASKKYFFCTFLDQMSFCYC